MIIRWHRHGAFLAGAVAFGLASVKPILAQNIIVVNLKSPSYTSSLGLAAGSARQVGTANGKGILWTGSASGSVALAFSPTGVSGDQVVGNNGDTVAELYNVSTQTVTTLNPPAFSVCQVKAVGSGSQAGYGSATALGQNEHALLWQGTAASVVDLHPAGFVRSFAYAVGNGMQAGVGLDQVTANFHALLWQGTAASVTDINPANFDNSYAYGVGGSQVAGSGSGAATTGGSEHALLWPTVGGTAVDLNPTGFGSSRATGTNGAVQVGWGVQTSTNTRHALIWFGSAATVLDLHASLPAGFTNSMAMGVDSSQNVVGSALTTQGIWQAVIWRVLPGVTPAQGGNAGQVTPRMSSAGEFSFTSPTQVALVASGQPTIVGTNPIVLDTNNLTAVFDLTDAAPGLRDAVFTFSDGSSNTIPAAFTVIQGGSPLLWASAVGRNIIRTGIANVYTFNYGNTGTVDAGKSTLWFAFPNFLTWSPGFIQTPSQRIYTHQTATETIVGVTVASVPLSITGTLAIQLTLPPGSGTAHQVFNIRVWIN